MATNTCSFAHLLQVVEVIRNPDRPGDGEEETDQTVSKEEEERYRKLQQENEQLQQLIASREQKLKVLNQRLLERNASSSANANGLATNPISASSVHNTVSTPSATGTPRPTIHLPSVKKNRFGTLFFFLFGWLSFCMVGLSSSYIYLVCMLAGCDDLAR